MDAFEERMRTRAPSWSAFDIRMMFQGYLERGFAAEKGDLETLSELLGHAPRSYEEFARETALEWQNNKGLHLRACWDSGFSSGLGCDSSFGWTDSF
jgi:hypothetical protein